MSACLLGDLVRYDGGHKKNIFIINAFQGNYEFVKFCPEVGIGLGVPRETIHLREMKGIVQTVNTQDVNKNYTNALRGYVQQEAETLGQLSGLILKSRSPSCGFKSTPVFDASGNSIPNQFSSGGFTQAVHELFPNLPIVEESQLLNEASIEEFKSRLLVVSKN